MAISAFLAAGAVTSWFVTEGCRPSTRIAERQIFTGATTQPASEVPDWPHWLGPRRDGIASAIALAPSWPAEGPRRLWAADVGIGFSSPVAADGVVYLFSLNNGREALTAFDATTGRIVWNVEDPSGWSGSYPGARATPAISGDFIYTFGGAGDLLCRKRSDGGVVWRANALTATGSTAGNLDWGTSSSPLLANGNIYVQGGHEGPVALAFKQQTGELAWTSEASGQSGYASPILIDVSGVRQLVVFGGTNLYGINPVSGKTIWSFPWQTDYGVNGSTPIYRDGYLFITSSYNKGCAMLKVEPTGVRSAWENKEVLSRFQPAILDDNDLFTSSEGTIKCLSWPDGAVRWTAKQPRLGVGGSLLRVGDQLITMSERGELSLSWTTPTGLQVQTKAKLFDASQVWSIPLLYAGRLYAKGEAEFVCLEVAQAAPPPASAPATSQPVAISLD